MVRRFTPETKIGFKPLYWVGIAFIIVLWIWGYKLYFDRYSYLHPDITWAVPGVYNDVVKVHGVLLWKEIPIAAAISGTVTYPCGAGPVRVARGTVVARIAYGSLVKEIKAYQQGYFIAAVDGLESKWRYSELWPGTDEFPKKSPLVMMKNSVFVGKGKTIGKLIEQPQELRFVGYSDVKGDMEQQIKSKKIRVKMDGVDTVSKAEIRVVNRFGHKIKLYLTLPWFQPDVILSRYYTLNVEAGRLEGALVPETAVLKKEGVLGIYIIRGSRVVFKAIEGKPIDGGKFLVTHGISVGDAIVENADGAREGRIQLW